MTCQFYLSFINEPWKYLVITFFVILALMTSLANVIALIILCKPSMRSSKSNRIVISLVMSDLLAGCAFLPVLAYQMSSEVYLRDCTFENIRIGISTLTIGTSSMNVALTAIDRYFLTTRYASYVRNRGKIKIIILLICVWLMPLVNVSLKYVNPYAYIVFGGLIIFGTISAQVIFYALLLSKLKLNAKKIAAYKCTNVETSCEKKSQDNLRKSTKNTKLVKTTLILTASFIVCLLPTLLSLALAFFYRGKSPVFMGYLNIFVLLSAAANSCINPFIYASRFPKFRFHLKVLFRLNSTKSMESKMHSSSVKENQSFHLTSIESTQQMELVTINSSNKIGNC